MTRKHYVTLADELGYAMAVEDSDGEQAVKRCAEIMANVLAQDNPRFDRERFLSAVEEAYFDWELKIGSVLV